MSALSSPYTVKGFLLRDCPLDALEAEAQAARDMMASGWTGPYLKLTAVEREITLRKASGQTGVAESAADG
jgi:hypothetical protein